MNVDAVLDRVLNKGAVIVGDVVISVTYVDIPPAKPVLSTLEFVRQLIHKQALRRMEVGSLSEAQLETLEMTLLRLETQLEEVKRHFDLDSWTWDRDPSPKLFPKARSFQVSPESRSVSDSAR